MTASPTWSIRHLIVIQTIFTTSSLLEEWSVSLIGQNYSTRYIPNLNHEAFQIDCGAFILTELNHDFFALSTD